MTLRLLKPTMKSLRTGLPLIERFAPNQHVKRMAGNSIVSIRKRLLARSGALCECDECQAGYPRKLTLATMEADHVVPLYQGGDNSFANFRALHVDCHQRITDSQAAERAYTRGKGNP